MDVVKLKITPGHLWSAGIIWPIVCTGVVGARFATRRAYSRLGWDDWLSLPALIGLYGVSAAVIYGVAIKAMGYPDENYNFNYVEYQSRTLTINRKVYWSSAVVLAATLGFIKLSCLAFYYRAFKMGIHRVAEAILWSLIVITVIWGISFTVANLLFCGNLSHLEWLWSRGGDYLKCTTDTYMLQKSFAISDVVTDALIVLYPLPFVARLQISLARKVAIAFVFLLGSATLAMSAVRLECLLQAVKVTKELVVGNPDVGPGDILTVTTYFMIMEAGFGLCAICLPTLSSTTRISGVQTFFQNVSKIFSVRSNSSVTSSGSRDKNPAVGEKTSGSLERAHSNEIEVQTA